MKNVEPRPSVGFKFHAVLVVNSAHLASLASPAEHRWLPIFWALDYFKSAEAQRRGGRATGRCGRSTSRPCPPAHKRGRRDSSPRWTTGTKRPPTRRSPAWPARPAPTRSTRCSSATAARDFRSIGHKAIYVANSCRTLQCIGWQHAEPVLRSLAYALLMHEGGNPAKRDDGGRPAVPPQRGTGEADSRRVAGRQARRRRPRRLLGDAAHRVER